MCTASDKNKKAVYPYALGIPVVHWKACAEIPAPSSLTGPILNPDNYAGGIFQKFVRFSAPWRPV